MADPDDLDRLLLGEVPSLDRDRVSAEVGVPLDDARALWSALGLPEVPEGVPAFTAGDVEALRLAVGLREGGHVDGPTLLGLARVMGQGLARLAESQVEVFRVALRDASPEEARELATAAAQEVWPDLDRLLTLVWRRQFAAAVGRAFRDGTHSGESAVGFLDLVSFTKTTRELDAAELDRLLGGFEDRSAAAVTAGGGRVVKTLGDGVLYATPDAPSAVDVALAVLDGPDEVRAGVALGPVLERLGDVFGEPVNLASRLCSVARPGSVLVDLRASEALREDPAFEVRPIPARSVNGYRNLRPHVVRRSG